MDIVNWQTDSAQSARETDLALEADLALAARDEARVDRAYTNLAAQLHILPITTLWPNYLCAAGNPVQIYGDFLHPFVLNSPKS